MTNAVHIPLGEVGDNEAVLTLTEDCGGKGLTITGERALREHFALHIAEMIWQSETDAFAVLSGNDGMVINKTSQLREVNAWMDFVHSTLRDAGVYTLDEYNALCDESGTDPIPYTVVFISEEHGEGGEYGELFERVAMLKRAVGLTLIVLADERHGREYLRARALDPLNDRIAIAEDGQATLALTVDGHTVATYPIDLYYAP